LAFHLERTRRLEIFFQPYHHALHDQYLAFVLGPGLSQL
jgi:hypothetical protein